MATVELFSHSKQGLQELNASPETPWETTLDAVLYDPRFEQALDTVGRWHDTAIRPGSVRESDLGHVESMEEIFTHILFESPAVAAEVHPSTVYRMIRIHDAGEIITGDLPVTNTDERARKIKNRSESLAIVLMSRNLAEPAKTDFRETYHTYEQRESKEAVLTKWIDVVQGNSFALDHGLYDTIIAPEDQRDHVVNRIKDMIQWTTRAVDTFTGEQAKADILSFATMEMLRFEDAGYSNYIEEAIDSAPQLPS